MSVAQTFVLIFVILSSVFLGYSAPMKTTLPALLLVLSACTSVNPAERAHFQETRMRHGIVPIEDPQALDKLFPQKKDAASVARGKQIYQKDCLSCHGEKGLGDGPLASEQKVRPADLVAAVKDVPNFTFYLSISQWQGKMPGWKTPHSSRDREDIAAYLKTFR